VCGVESWRPPAGFYCGWARLAAPPGAGEPSGARARLVPHSAVNDGICDCCAGEDEWQTGARCPDRCLEAEGPGQAERASRALLGAAARARHAERGRQLAQQPQYSGLPGGPDHAFLAVAEKGCFRLDEGSAIYKVCLLDRVTHQIGEKGRPFVLGRGGAFAEAFWESGQLRRDYSRLNMGDGEWCHKASVNRSVEVLFECAPADALLSITETYACSFVVRFETPAACGVGDSVG